MREVPALSDSVDEKDAGVAVQPGALAGVERGEAADERQRAAEYVECYDVSHVTAGDEPLGVVDPIGSPYDTTGTGFMGTTRC